VWAWFGSSSAVAVFALGVVAWAIVARRVEIVVLAAIAAGITDPLCARVLKPLAGRDRPCRAEDTVETPAGCGPGESMPSGHAANTAAVAAALGSPALLGLSAIVGTSRIVDGQHYPSDVIAGWMVGGGVGLAVARAAARVRRRRPAEEA
jgi:undecaprenyl-diphosphatase